MMSTSPPPLARSIPIPGSSAGSAHRVATLEEEELRDEFGEQQDAFEAIHRQSDLIEKGSHHGSLDNTHRGSLDNSTTHRGSLDGHAGSLGHHSLESAQEAHPFPTVYDTPTYINANNPPLSALHPPAYLPSSLPSFGLYGPSSLPSAPPPFPGAFPQHNYYAGPSQESQAFPRRVRKTSFDHTVSRAGIVPGGSGRHQVNGRPDPADTTLVRYASQHFPFLVLVLSAWYTDCCL